MKRIQVLSRTGHFDFAHPRDESISMSIRVFDESGLVQGCSIEPEYEMSLSDFDLKTIAEDLAQMIEDYQKKLWISTAREKDLAFAKYLRDNAEELTRGTIEYRLQKLKEEKERIEKETESLKLSLAFQKPS